ncbi:PIR protein [Plasmodium vivax]|uniref:VIR protein n=1 Tax=Plasmodium vivax TaxID=5855 RepID=A0A565A441_PLAVI|nr:PIR protein [Plasmodium vivax]
MYLYEYVSSLLRCKKELDRITVHNERDLLSTCNAIVSQVSGNHKFVRPCQKIIKYLKIMQEGSYKNDHKIDDCRYLNLYINEHVYSAYGNPLTDDTYNTFIGVFKSKYSELNTCNDYMKYIDKEVVVDVNKILDMYEKLNEVIDHSNPTSDDTCSNIQKCLNIYMSFQSKCENDNDSQLCNALENFCKYYLLKSYLVKRCKDDILFPSFKKAKEVPQDQYGSLNLPDPQDETEQDDPADSFEMSDSLGDDNSSSKSSNSKTITAISTTLLLFPTLFSLYKFTPLGSFIRPYMQRNEKVQYNANDEMLQLYLPNYKALDNINKEQLNVLYHS